MSLCHYVVCASVNQAFHICIQEGQTLNYLCNSFEHWLYVLEKKKFLLFLGCLCEHRRIQEYISSDVRAGWIWRALQADWESLLPIGHNGE